MSNYKITVLYIAVHFFKNEKKWRSETWIDKAFNNNDIETVKIDYREIIKLNGYSHLKQNITVKSKNCDIIFLQRAEKIDPNIFSDVKIPIIFWSTEPIQLKNDVDQLLKTDIFSWVYVHSYSCFDRVQKEFSHLIKKCSVLHNALPQEKINFENKIKKNFAIFNRNLSIRRRWWIMWSYKYIKIIRGHYGDQYFNDLSESYISVNIHYSSKNTDDFETGIFEALARGCIVLSEKLSPKVLNDLNLKDAIIEVKSPNELREKLIFFKNNLNLLSKYEEISKDSILKNTWDYRFKGVKNKIEEILNLKT